MEDRGLAMLRELNALVDEYSKAGDNGDVRKIAQSVVWMRKNLNVDQLVELARESELDHREVVIELLVGALYQVH